VLDHSASSEPLRITTVCYPGGFITKGTAYACLRYANLYLLGLDNDKDLSRTSH
jgi:hypothetical protein